MIQIKKKMKGYVLILCAFARHVSQFRLPVFAQNLELALFLTFRARF